MIDRYNCIIFWSEEDDCFIAKSDYFKMLSAFGNTRLEALKEFEIALKLFIEAFTEVGLLSNEHNK